MRSWPRRSGDRPKWRTFTPEYEPGIVEEYERLTEPGAKGAVLRREGLCHSRLIDWTVARDAGALNGLAANTTRPKGRIAAEKENEQLAAELALAKVELTRTQKALAIMGSAPSTPGRRRPCRSPLRTRPTRRAGRPSRQHCRESSLAVKTTHLTVYNYGTGGAWAYLLADPPAQINQRFPELQIVNERPGWLTDQEDRHLRARMTVDIDDTNNPVLAALLRQRT